jgi:hypothetical protein
MTVAHHERIINGATGPTPAPTGAGFNSGRFPRVRSHIAYGGAIIGAPELRLWLRNPRTGGWSRGASTNDASPLTGTNEVRDWDIGPNQEIAFQVVALAGTSPTITVDVEAVG